jgi:cation transport regulator
MTKLLLLEAGRVPGESRLCPGEAARACDTLSEIKGARSVVVQDEALCPSHRTTSFRRRFAAICRQRRRISTATYGNEPRREEIAHRVAWAAVKHRYQKGADGDWHPRE